MNNKTSAVVAIRSRPADCQVPAYQDWEELRKLESLGRVVASVSHDFNNLITGILLYSDLLMAGLPAKSRMRRHAQEIRAAGEHGAALIQQLLALTRRQPPEPRLRCWNEVLQQLSDMLARLAGESIRIATELAPDLECVRMDPTQMQQMIVNLVLNARDAMPEGGEVRIITRNRRQTKQVELEVSDTGLGMDAKTRDHLFEPFYTTKPLGQGSGLGLSTVYDIVKHAGGTVSVVSEPGKGTRVAIDLPAMGILDAKVGNPNSKEVSHHERNGSHGPGPRAPDRRGKLPKPVDRR